MTKDYTKNCTNMSYLAAQDRLMSITEYTDCSASMLCLLKMALPDFPRFRWNVPQVLPGGGHPPPLQLPLHPLLVSVTLESLPARCSWTAPARTCSRLTQRLFSLPVSVVKSPALVPKQTIFSLLLVSGQIFDLQLPEPAGIQELWLKDCLSGGHKWYWMLGL